jgi:hypothetical protein
VGCEEDLARDRPSEVGQVSGEVYEKIVDGDHANELLIAHHGQPTDCMGAKQRSRARSAAPKRARTRKGSMKAAVVHEFGRPLKVEDIPIPEPGSGEIVVKVETSGLCHTDVHAAHGDWPPVKPKPPFIPTTRPSSWSHAWGPR